MIFDYDAMIPYLLNPRLRDREEIERLRAEIATLRNFINAAKAQLDLALADYGQPK